MASPRFAPWAFALALGLMGCAGPGQSPITPDGGTASLDGIGGHYGLTPVVMESPDNLAAALGRIQIAIGPDLTGELLFTREAEAFGQVLSTDITGLFPAGWPNQYVRLVGITWSPEHRLVVEMEIEHPFPAPDLDAPLSGSNRADLHANHLRAIVLVDGTDSYDLGGTSSFTANTHLVRNADGYTDLFPAPEGSGVNATHFPYIVFGTSNPQQTSAGNYHVTSSGGLGWNFIPLGSTDSSLDTPTGFNVFAQGSTLRGSLELDHQPGERATLDLLLAVNYSPSAQGKACRLPSPDCPDGPEYFLPATAPQEAWKIAVAQTAGGLEAGPNPGDPQFAKTASFRVDVYDWQHGRAGDVVGDYPRSNFRVGLAAASDIASVKVFIPEILDGSNNPRTLIVPTPDPDNPPEYGAPQSFTFAITNTQLEAPEGTYYGLVEVRDNRVPDPDLTTLGESSSTFGIDASTLEFRTLPDFRTYQIFPIVVGEGNLAPTSRAIATTTTNILQGGTVTFNATPTDPNLDPLTLTWDFNGDGIYGDSVKDNFTGSITNPVHTFLAPGTVQVNLKVDDGRGGIDTLDAAGVAPFIRIPVTITPQNIPPVACFTVTSDISYIFEGATVSFNGACTFDTDAFALEWDFNGDGSFGDAWTNFTPPSTYTYTYTSAGQFPVSVRARELSTGELYVSPPAPSVMVNIRRIPSVLTNPTISPRYFGRAIAVADFSNDGLDDIAVAATGWHTTLPTETVDGRLYFFINQGGFFSPAPQMTVTAIATGGTNTKGGYGWGLHPGDVNNDGWNDLAVGMYQYTASATFEGRAEVIINRGASAPAPFHFTTSAAAARPAITWPVANPFISSIDSFGTAVRLYDLNNDNLDDMLVGAYNVERPGGRGQAGECYAFRSTGAGMLLSATLQKDPFYTAEFLGTEIEGGDFDGDGDIDAVGGVPGAKPNGQSDAGQLCLWENRYGEPGYFGDGTTTDPGRIFTTVAGAGINQASLLTFHNPVSDTELGWSLTSGDIDNNGYWDLVGGLPGYSEGNRPSKSGGVAIYMGRPNFMSAPPPANHVVFSTNPYDSGQFGWDSILTDIDGDLDLDLVAGSPFHGAQKRGLAEVFKWTGTGFNPQASVLRAVNLEDGAEFGFNVAAGNLSLAVGSEVVVGIPRSPVATRAGQIQICPGPF